MNNAPRPGVALVTGSARRIGAAIATHLASRGWDLVLHFDSSGAQATQLAVELAFTYDTRCATVQADLSDPRNAEGLLAQIPPEFLPLGLLVNNAAVFPQATLAKTDLELLEATLNLNLVAPLVLARAFAAQAPKGSSIINLLDALQHPIPGRFAYHVSKAALRQATALLARELAPEIKVNALALGPVLAPEDQPEDYLQRLTARLPLPRPGRLEEIGAALDLLLSRDFHSTGAEIPVDGGLHLL